MNYEYEYQKYKKQYLDIKRLYYSIGGSKKLRPSPSESATLYKVGTKKKGNDNNIWIIVEDKNSIKRWKLYKKPTKIKKDDSSKTKLTPERKVLSVLDFYDVLQVNDAQLETVTNRSSDNIRNIYKIIKKNIIPQLDKLGWSTDIVPLPLSKKGIYWTDYPYDYLKEKHGEKWFNRPSMYFIIYMNKDGQSLNLNRNIKINFSHMNKDMKIKIINLFQNTLSDNYEWSGDNNDVMTIYYLPKTIKKIDISKLKSEDIFPQLSFGIDVKKDLFDINIDDLNVIKDIKRHIKKFKYNVEYGQNDIYIKIFGVNESKVFKLYNDIMNAINIKDNQVTNYYAYYYLDGNKYYELKKKKLMIKDKKALTLSDFIKKYGK